MNKEQEELLGEAFKNYLKDLMRDNVSKDDPNYILLAKEEFINKCKTNPEFSERWGLKIEERELSRDERIDLYCKEYTGGVKGKYEPPFDDFIDSKLTTRNIPNKLITITYNDRKL